MSANILCMFRRLGILSLVALLACGCHADPDQVGSEVKRMLQSKLDENPELKGLRPTVSKVEVIREQGNKYEGIATVIVSGKEHSVTMAIWDDGKRTMYQAAPDDLTFLAEQAIENSARHRPSDLQGQPAGDIPRASSGDIAGEFTSSN